MEAAPPVHFPEAGSDLPPSVGFPIPVRDDGTLALPLVTPIDVRGMTIAEVEQRIRKAYISDRQILKEGRDRILVSVMRERTVRVIVVREDAQAITQQGGGNQVISGSTRAGEGFTLDLPVYKNDLMHALAETGGLPGLNAKNEVKIIKSERMRGKDAVEYLDTLYGPGCQPCVDACCPTTNFDDPAAIRIPLRVPPGMIPQIRPEDIILKEGDIVVIEARDTEVFYTGGLLRGGQYQLPRDYDLDVFGAMAIAGQGIGGGGQSGGGGGGGSTGGIMPGLGGATPTQLFILRKTRCGGEVNISVDLAAALNNPAERILVQPGDTLILRYKPCEELLNFGLATFFTFGIRELFND